MDPRIGNVQRAQVLNLLTRALEEGYLSLDEFEHRMASTNAAKLTSELSAQVGDLPAQFRWDAATAHQVAAREQQTTDNNIKSFAQAALILGIASLPLSLCLVGGLLGLVAIFLSVPGSRGTSGWSMAIIGRVLGIVGVLMTLGVALIIAFGPDQP